MRLTSGVPFRLPAVPFFLLFFFPFLFPFRNSHPFSGKKFPESGKFCVLFLPGLCPIFPLGVSFVVGLSVIQCCKVRKGQQFGGFIFALLITNTTIDSMELLTQIGGGALKLGGALFNAWAGSRAAKKIASEETKKNRDLLLMNAKRRNESALENAENRLQMTRAMGAFNSAANRQAGAGAVTGASNSRIALQRQANNMAIGNVAAQQSAAAVAQHNRLLDEQANLTAQGYDAKIKRIQGQRDAMQQAGTGVASLGDSLMTSGLKQS